MCGRSMCFQAGRVSMNFGGSTPAIHFYSGVSIPPSAMTTLKRFATHKMQRALRRDTAHSKKAGAFPCGAPLDIGEDVEHWRLARMTTRKIWEEAKRRFAEGRITICQWCYQNAEAEASITDREDVERGETGASPPSQT